MKHSLMRISAATLAIISIAVAFNREPVTSRSSAANRAKTASQEEAETLAKKSGCLKCHSTNKALVGPAFSDVASRYKDDPRARAALIKTVQKGGKGHWTEVTGGVPMPAHSPRLTDAEIRRLVDWVLSQ